MRRLSGYVAIAARLPILIAMAASGLFALVMPRRRVRAGPPNPRPVPKPRKSPQLRHSDWERSSKHIAAEARSGFLASCRRAEPKDYREWARDLAGRYRAS